MRKRVQILLVSLGVMAIVSGCNKLGMFSETYVNEKDPSQILELTSRATAKGLIVGGRPALDGHYTFQNDQRVLGGTYVSLKDPASPDGAEPQVFVLKSDDNKVLKFWHLRGQPALRDETGGIWKLQSRSHEWRGSASAQVLPPTLHERK